MSGFAELGLGDAVVEAASAAGFDAPTPLQASSIPVLRRGGNVVLHASSGAGVTAAFGLPLLDRLAGEAMDAGPGALVLAPTAERADALTDALSALAGATGLSVRATGPGWRLEGTAVLVTTPAAALAAVKDSELKLESVRTLVVTEASELFSLGQGETLETLTALVPREAQRVVASPEVNAAVERFVEAHARRAMTMPARPADRAAQAEREPIGRIGFVVVQDSAKTAMTARLLEGGEGAALVFTRSTARAARVADELARRGIAAGDGTSVQTLPFAEAGAHEAPRIVSYDVPFSAEMLRAVHATGGTVLVTPAELRYLERIAGEVPFTLKQRKARVVQRDALDGYRAKIAGALAAEDLDAQLLILEPLFDDHPAEQVAAALSALLRKRAPVKAAEEEVSVQPSAGAPATFTRLFVSIGSRDNVRPGDLVGAITGESGIRGDQVGRVDIRDTFSVVEVAASAADRVIRALNGTTMRGRSLRVDYDRKSGGDERGRGGARAPREGPGRGPPRPRRRPGGG